MRGGQDHLCGCFPTGRHYPGIADRIARAVERVEGLAREFDAASNWADIPFAVIDFETTGRHADQDRIVEIGIVCFAGGEVTNRHGLLVNPGMHIADEASAVHGITDADVADKPTFAEVLPQVLEALRGHLPVAYNAEFDRKFLHAEFERAGGTAAAGTDLPPALQKDVVWIDPLVWAREILQELKSRALGEVCSHLGIALENAHRATDDSEATGQVLLELAGQMPKSYGELIRLQGRYAARQEADMAAWRNRRN
jgi:DNA polymerase-3 subunit epsilon